MVRLVAARCRAAYGGRAATSSIEAYLEAVCGPGIRGTVKGVDAEEDHAERWMDESPLMLAELFAQEEDLAALRAAVTLTPELLRAMREKSQKAGIQPFERGLVKRENIPASPRPVPPAYFCDECPQEGVCEVCGGTGRLRNISRNAGT